MGRSMENNSAAEIGFFGLAVPLALLEVVVVFLYLRYYYQLRKNIFIRFLSWLCAVATTFSIPIMQLAMFSHLEIGVRDRIENFTVGLVLVESFACGCCLFFWAKMFRARTLESSRPRPES